MRLVERVLREEDTTIAEIARSLGYTSESAFSNAFERVSGKSPRAYRNTLESSVDDPDIGARV
jgi:AraC-like DNA-binding protein